MTKLVLSALIGLVALGIVAGTSTAQAAPPPLHCVGVNSVWDDTDIVHLTINTGAGNDQIVWRASGHTTLNCGSGSPLTGKLAQIEQRVDAQIQPSGAIHGRGQTRISVNGLNHSFQGRFTGATTVNQGVLTVHGDFNTDGVVDGADFLVWRLHMHEHGTVDIRTKHSTNSFIDNILFDRM